jgi:MerR family copper efflux transcriptional regulator
MPQNDEKELLRIGELAKLTGENTPTLNYWTTMGLLKPSGTTEKGYRLYSSKAVEVVKKIRKMQGKGSLKAIQAKLAGK